MRSATGTSTLPILALRDAGEEPPKDPLSPRQPPATASSRWAITGTRPGYSLPGENTRSGVGLAARRTCLYYPTLAENRTTIALRGDRSLPQWEAWDGFMHCVFTRYILKTCWKINAVLVRTPPSDPAGGNAQEIGTFPGLAPPNGSRRPMCPTSWARQPQVGGVGRARLAKAAEIGTFPGAAPHQTGSHTLVIPEIDAELISYLQSRFPLSVHPRRRKSLGPWCSGDSTT